MSWLDWLKDNRDLSPKQQKRVREAYVAHHCGQESYFDSNAAELKEAARRDQESAQEGEVDGEGCPIRD